MHNNPMPPAMQTPPTRASRVGAFCDSAKIRIVGIGLRKIPRERRPAILRSGAGTKRLVARDGQDDDAELVSSCAARDSLGMPASTPAFTGAASPAGAGDQYACRVFEDDAIGVGHHLYSPG